jgi:hypothetical protein
LPHGSGANWCTFATWLSRIDSRPAPWAGSGARDWAALSNRLHLFAELFRCYHERESLFNPPFTAEQVAAIRARPATGGSAIAISAYRFQLAWWLSPVAPSSHHEGVRLLERRIRIGHTLHAIGQDVMHGHDRDVVTSGQFQLAQRLADPLVRHGHLLEAEIGAKWHIIEE